MIPIPDFSYFALNGFLRNKTRRAGSSSLFLFQENHLAWDDLLESSTSLLNYIHEQAGKPHDIYIPKTPDETFIFRHESHFRNFLAPAMQRIQTLLMDCDVEDVEEYMEDSLEWLGLLYAQKEQQYRAGRLLAEKINIDSSKDFPMMFVWTNHSDVEAMIIPLVEDMPKLESYFKTMIWSLTTSTKTLLRKESLSIDNLLSETHHTFKRSMFFRDKQETIPQIRKIGLSTSIENMLNQIGKVYAEEFDDAILNFARHVKENKVKFLKRFCSECKRDVEKLLEENGFIFKRHGTNHDVWKHPKLNKNTQVPRHTQVTALTMKSIRHDIFMATQAEAIS